MSLLLLAALLGLIPAVIAGRRGHNAFGWWLFGAALFILALPLAIFTTGKTCPNCRSRIHLKAAACPSCQAPQPVTVTA